MGHCRNTIFPFAAELREGIRCLFKARGASRVSGQVSQGLPREALRGPSPRPGEASQAFNKSRCFSEPTLGDMFESQDNKSIVDLENKGYLLTPTSDY